jgi:hypothetical protein
MVSQRWRPVLFCALAVVAIWIIALTGFTIARNSRPTADRVRAYIDSVELNKLSASQRARAIQKLAAKLNALPVDERRRAQFEQIPRSWFEQMTEEEKKEFLDATTPIGFTQMLTAFQQLPEDKRRLAIEDTVRRLRDSQKKLRAEGGGSLTNTLPPLNGELLARIRAMGLVDFYGQSSLQTKAELAPVLEELQRVMESGRPFRGR